MRQNARVDVACAGCRAPLFKYAKGNGAGSKLVKCWAERIVKDYTEDGVTCPKCGAVFARGRGGECRGGGAAAASAAGTPAGLGRQA